ncbi:MAG: FHA domain-containing protein [Myxococcales bacterium]|nr:FHA domain-containing protein [Myxococcales bacterium]
MSTQDQNKKTLRHFQCRDYLWAIFEQMSAELECSTDYLINEAMRQYARSRNYGTSRSGPKPEPQAPGAGAPASAPIPSLRQGSPATPSGSLPSPGRPMAPARPALPSAPGLAGGAAGPQRPASMPPPPPRAPAPAPPPRPAPAPPRPAVSAPPPLPQTPVAQHGVHHPQLFVIFNGQKIPVNKDEFVIGRGSKGADLAIKDGNISRRHAAIVWHNGAHYMKDLGSTNGVEFQGRRFDSKRIDEGDLYRICDYELQFTYR